MLYGSFLLALPHITLTYSFCNFYPLSCMYNFITDNGYSVKVPVCEVLELVCNFELSFFLLIKWFVKLSCDQT